MNKTAVVSHVLLLILLGLLLAACSHNPQLETAAGQERFGVRMAKMNLWREALFRFRRASELSPQDAEAYNNLAVAYEANGDFENAAKAYREAMRLDKSNQFIQKNYSRLVEFTSRNKKRSRPVTASQQPAAATSPGASAPAAAPAGGASPPAAPTDSAAPPAAPAPAPTPPPAPPSTSPAPSGGSR